MILYHGSGKVVDNPNPHFKNPNNDFGSGFYLGDDYQISAEWACLKRDNEDGKIVNKYDFD